MTSPIVGHVVASIAPASHLHASAARDRVATAGELTGHSDSGEERSPTTFERLAALLGGAQHTHNPRATPRYVVVVAADRASGTEERTSGAAHPTVVAAQSIATGTAALSRIARTANAPIILVDAGAAESAHLPVSAIAVGRQPHTASTRVHAPAIDDAYGWLEAGIALAISLTERELALFAVGAIGVGGDAAAADLLEAFGDSSTGPTIGAELLTSFAGPDIGVLAGLMLGAASMNIPVILDNSATGAAALVAAAIAPSSLGYLIAAHRGNGAMPGVLARLGLKPIFDIGIGRGDGTGAAMVLPFVDQVASLAQDHTP